MVVSNDGDFVGPRAPAREPRRRADKYDNVVAGTNSRLDTLQAAVLRVKLRHLDPGTASAASGSRPTRGPSPGAPAMKLPRERAGGRSAWHLYTIRAADRDASRHLAGKGIATAVHYPRPIHLQPAMALRRAAGRPARLGAALPRGPLAAALSRAALEAVDEIAGLVR